MFFLRLEGRRSKEGPMRCLSCGSENPDGAKFCIECAAPLRQRCPRCGAENLPRAKFCGECATPLSARSPVAEPRDLTSSSPPASYTPKHLAERILAEQAALETRGA